MSLESGSILTIEGNTLEECKRKLYEKYGNDYNIIERKSIIKPSGFLWLKQKEIQQVSYTVNHKRSYQNEVYSEKDRKSEDRQDF